MIGSGGGCGRESVVLWPAPHQALTKLKIASETGGEGMSGSGDRPAAARPMLTVGCCKGKGVGWGSRGREGGRSAASGREGGRSAPSPHTPYSP